MVTRGDMKGRSDYQEFRYGNLLAPGGHSKYAVAGGPSLCRSLCLNH